MGQCVIPEGFQIEVPTVAGIVSSCMMELVGESGIKMPVSARGGTKINTHVQSRGVSGGRF